MNNMFTHLTENYEACVAVILFAIGMCMLLFDKNLITNYDLMADGQIVETGTPDEFFDHPQTKRAQDFLNSIKGH